jgi:hypothetical protein
MEVFLIAHVARASGKQVEFRRGSNPGQLRVKARSETKALAWFLDNFPQRRITYIGKVGEGDGRPVEAA